jgi:osmoprotectant transport system ATP-binding protein
LSEIVFRDVRVTRGAVPVLRGLSLEVRQGETLALVGRSGAGKSTILKLVNRLLVPQSGDVIVRGKNTTDWDAFELRRSTGYVLQEVGLFPHLNVRDNIAVVPRLLGWDENRVRTRVDELLELVNLSPAEFSERRPADMSGGQRQRVGVARALAAKPSILLMDEPFGALDPITRAELHHEFRRIRAALDQTIVIVTHDMGEAMTLGSRIGVLADGELAALDEPSAIAASADPHVRAMLAPLIEAADALNRRGTA